MYFVYYIEDPWVVIYISSASRGLMFVRLSTEIWDYDRVALKGEVGSEVGEWGKWCGGC
jgi:hypothetical protein